MFIFSGVVFLFTLALTVWAWGKIPATAQIPFHWNIQGKVDNYASKPVGLLMGPVMIIFLTLLMILVPRMEPRKENLEQSQKAYRIVIGGLLVFFAGLHLITILATLGHESDVGMMMAFLLGALFVAIGNYLGKIRSNFMFGIRTPWTLSSEVSWNKTHRLGGMFFFIVGLLVFLSGFFHNGELTFGILFGGLLFSVLALFGYSYWVWKSDEDKA